MSGLQGRDALTTYDAGSTFALAESLTAQRVFQRQFVLVNALLDEQQILRIRRVDHSARKQIAQLILPVLTVKPDDLVNRFDPRRAEFVGPQIRLENESPGESQPLLQSSNLIERIPHFLVPATQTGAFLVPLDRLGQITGIAIALGEVENIARVVRLGIERALE